MAILIGHIFAAAKQMSHLISHITSTIRQLMNGFVIKLHNFRKFLASCGWLKNNLIRLFKIKSKIILILDLNF